MDGAPDDVRAEALMEPGPSTTRPHTEPDELAKQLERSGTRTAILTTPEGELIGVVSRSDLPTPSEGVTE
jgi:CBS domain-containing protein